MCDTYKRRIADQHLHPLVKSWWYSLTESERNFWMRRAAAEKAKVATENSRSFVNSTVSSFHSRTKQTP